MVTILFAVVSILVFRFRSRAALELKLRFEGGVVLLALSDDLVPILGSSGEHRPSETPPTNPTSTLAQVQKVIQIITSDKVKTQQFCDIEKLDPQIAEAVQKNDPNKLEALIKQADDLAQKIGPEYVMMMEGLAQIDENSREGKQIADALDSLVKLCATK